jgi:hypothetical protein
MRGFSGSYSDDASVFPFLPSGYLLAHAPQEIVAVASAQELKIRVLAFQQALKTAQLFQAISE